MMEGQGIPEAHKKRLMIILVVILITLALISVGALWYFFYRPIGIIELKQRHVHVGDNILFEERISNISGYNTSYGHKTVLEFSNSSGSFGILVPEDNYQIGQVYRTQMHVSPFYFNGLKVVSTDEVFSPLSYSMAISSVVQGTSYASGTYIWPSVLYENGTSIYKVHHWGNATDLRTVGAVLQGYYHYSQYVGTTFTDFLPDSYESSADLLMATEYIQLFNSSTTDYRIDVMSNFSTGFSNNGKVRYADMNGNGKMDEGDELTICIPPTGDTRTYDSYRLSFISNIANDNLINYENRTCVKYLINGHKGMYEYLPLTPP